MAKAKSARLSCQDENFARRAQRAHVELFRQPAVGRRHNGLQPARLAQGANERAAGLIDVCVIDVLANLLVRPIGERRAELTVALVKEGPSKMRERRHHRSPPFALSSLSRSMKRWIFPVAVFGRLSTNSIQRGYFHGPIVRFTCTLSSSYSARLASLSSAILEHDEGLRLDQAVVVLGRHDRRLEHLADG